MKKMKNLLIVSIAIIAICAMIMGIYFYSKNQIVIIRDHTLVAPEIVWSYQEENMDAEIADPKTLVSVQIGDKKQGVGEYAGSCWEIPAEDLEKNEISGIRCWWAGGGDDIGVFHEDNTFVVKHRALEEGSAEEGGFIGEFEKVSSL